MTGLDFENKAGIGVFTMDFDLDLYHAKDFKDEVLKTIQDNQLKKAVLNFSKVKYLDSSGTGALVGILQKVSATVALRICCMQESVLKVLKLAHLERIFNIDASEEESLNK